MEAACKGTISEGGPPSRIERALQMSIEVSNLSKILVR